ncbi:dienelactone hydrolase family protein [Hymenobacter segetis]|uniref:Alpha/beta hydrolase n=1 Tax=Hymenobacter segetis TaxID=2025509 RepID=A0ABU9M058_9BACT
MRQLLLFLLLLVGLGSPVFAQKKTAVPRTPLDFGFGHLVVMFGKDSVDLLIQSPPGREAAPLPVLLWAQGSLPKPLILYDQHGAYGVFPFLNKKAFPNCHLVIIGKPGVPMVMNVEGRNPNQLFSTATPTAYYCQRNYLDYYVRRDEAIIRYLKKQPWVDAKNVVAGGHSEGSAVVAQLAAMPGLLRRAVYLSGSPLGRELTKIARDPTDADSAAVEAEFARWQHAVDHPTQNDCGPGDSDQNMFAHGQSELPALLGATVPIFVGYGTRDADAAANDYLRLEAIRQHKTTLTFRPYVGREHNFFGFKNGQVNYDDYYWEKVGAEFLRWAGLQ